MEGLLRRLVGAVTRRPLVVLGVTAALALAGGALALRLEPSAATETLVNRGSDTFKDTERFKRDFGDEAILVLVRGELTRTVLTADLSRLIRLEGCLSAATCRTTSAVWAACRPYAARSRSSTPRRWSTARGPSSTRPSRQIKSELAKQIQRSSTQATQAAEAARRLSKRRGDPPAEQERLAAAAAKAVQAQFINDALRLALKYGLTGPPRDQRPHVRVHARLRPHRRRAGRAEVALRLPVPVEELGADPDPAAARPD